MDIRDNPKSHVARKSARDTDESS